MYLPLSLSPIEPPSQPVELAFRLPQTVLNPLIAFLNKLASFAFVSVCKRPSPRTEGQSCLQEAVALAFEFVRLTFRTWEKKGFTFEFPQGGTMPDAIWFEEQEGREDEL